MITYKLRKTQKCEIILKDSKYPKKESYCNWKNFFKSTYDLLLQAFSSNIYKFTSKANILNKAK
jgi:hypothetical protein